MRGAIAVEALRWRWPAAPDRGVGPVSFTVPAGEVLCVVGANGAGKSTLLRLVAGLLGPYEGTVTVGGDRLADLDDRARARRVAWLPQRERVPTEMTVREYVSLGRAPHTNWLGAMRADDERAVESAMERVSLAELAGRAVATLSGGEQRRCGLARSLAQGADALLLDEPMASLDLKHQAELCRLVRERAAAGAAVIAVVHELTMASRLADRVLLLKDGEALALGPTDEVMTADRLGAAFDTEVERGFLEGGGACFAPRW